jgi:hypothetical protein
MQCALSSGALMFARRTLCRFAYAQLVLAALSEPALALDGSEASARIVAKPTSPVVMVAGRQGTRNYRPDAAESSAQAQENSAQLEETKTRLDQCMVSWDRGTHITQSSWRQICEREIKANE